MFFPEKIPVVLSDARDRTRHQLKFLTYISLEMQLSSGSAVQVCHRGDAHAPWGSLVSVNYQYFMLILEGMW